MKNIALLSIFATLMTFGQSFANDLSDFGLSSLEPISQEQVDSVRGQGLDSVGMSTFQIFAFDYLSGSSINLQSSSINASTGLHISGFDLDEIEPLVGTNSTAGMSAFGISIDGFTVETTDLSISSIGSAFFFGSDSTATYTE
ncbi:MAG: hypothetical protein VXZ38_10175 [Planctomycetota bacterium]|nr:hypothetical protein [Planctomycetota bacterium]